MILADTGASIPGRVAHDTAAVIFRLDDGTRGTMLVSKVASGAQNAILVEAYGEGGGVQWTQANPDELKVMRVNQPIAVRTRGLPGLHAHAKRARASQSATRKPFWKASPTSTPISPSWSRHGWPGRLLIRWHH